jgi:hypothetical protein
MRKQTIVLAALVAAVAIPAVAFGSMSPVSSAKLTGKAETPAGDPNGSGVVVLNLNAKTGRACWTFSKVKNIGTPNAAHIHKGKAGKVGPVVVPLGAAYKAKGCISASKNAIKQIEESPNRYYVNIHNAKYPNGAIRGQLAAGMTG